MAQISSISVSAILLFMVIMGIITIAVLNSEQMAPALEAPVAVNNVLIMNKSRGVRGAVSPAESRTTFSAIKPKTIPARALQPDQQRKGSYLDPRADVAVSTIGRKGLIDSPFGMCYSNSDKLLFVARLENGDLFRVNTQTDETALLAPASKTKLTSIMSCAVSNDGLKIYISGPSNGKRQWELKVLENLPAPTEAIDVDAVSIATVLSPLRGALDRILVTSDPNKLFGVLDNHIVKMDLAARSSEVLATAPNGGAWLDGVLSQNELSIYATDFHKSVIERIDLSSSPVTVTSVVSFLDGKPYALEIDHARALLYLSLYNDGRIMQADLQTGEFKTLAGAGGVAAADGKGDEAQFNSKHKKLSFDGDSTLYISEFGASRIRKAKLSLQSG